MEWKRIKLTNQINITEIITLFEEHFDSDWNFKGEAHDFWECVYVLNGKIYASGDGRVYSISKGEMIFHKPMEFHKLSVNCNDGADIFIFSFNAEGDLLPYFREKVFRLTFKQSENVFELLKYLRNYSPYQKNTVYPKRYHNNLSKDGIYFQTVVSYLHILLLSLADSENIVKTEKTYEANVFYEAVDFMEKNISNNLTSADIAMHCNTSLSTLKRIFSKHAGIPVHKYFLHMKIQNATEFLRKGNSVTHTAEKLGFSSQAYFSKFFKSMTGMNPIEVKMK